MHTPGSRRLRLGRSSEPGRICSITTATHDRRPRFTEFTSGRIVVEALRHAHERRWGTMLAYVVMPDHLHWLVELGSVKTLPALVQSVKSYSAQRVNSRFGRRAGRVWQTGYHERAIRKTDDVAGIARYIVLNPVRAGLVARIGDYPLRDAAWL